MRTKKALINTFASLAYEGVALICGMILPRLILGAFGSSYNGITASITQFISCVVLLRAGIAGVTRAALYKPLADKDHMQISRIMKATEQFMRRVALIFVVFLLAFACLYPFIVKDDFEWIFSATLVLIIGASTVIQYYFGFTYQMLIYADQRQYIISGMHIVTTILNTVVAAVLINYGAGIHAVKLGSAIVFALNPLFIHYYSKKKYCIDPNVEPDNMALGQRWDAFAHEVANFVNSNTDIIVITIFSNVLEVSVYTVYYLVINGVTRLLKDVTPGVAAAFGNMMAKGQHSLMEENFKLFEVVVYSLSTFLFGVTSIMLVPFVMLYTSGVNDVNYARPVFALVITLAAFFSCARLPYQQIVQAAGHYRQTKNGAFIEASINIVLSVACVARFGIVGVSIGTLVATVFRTFQYGIYLSKNIIPRSYWILIKHIGVSLAILGVALVIGYALPLGNIQDYLGWCGYALLSSLLVAGLVIGTDLLLYRKETVGCVKKIKNIAMKKSKAS